MSNSLRRYSIDVSFLSTDEQDAIYKKLQGSCWIVEQTDVPGIYDAFWENELGDITKLPYLPANCVILPLT